MKKIVCILMLLTLFGCTDATMRNFTTLGDAGTVKLYSGGELVETWISTGKITSESQTDGWKFVDKETNKLIRVTGTVVVIN